MLKRTAPLLALLFLVACLPTSPTVLSPAWTYADLRLLDSPGETSPSKDLLALYTRCLQNEFQVRLDILDLSPEPDSDLILALDVRPGGSTWLPLNSKASIQWDVLVHLPASGPMVAKTPQMDSLPDARLRAVRDPSMDTIEISLDSRSFLKAPSGCNRRPLKVQAFVSSAGMNSISDQTGPISSTSPSPGKAPVLIALWNTLPAVTPAQALRRWNGAHSGPFNARHGLHALVEAVQSSHFPVVLLDLKSPEALSSLDYLEALPQIRKLAQQGLLLLPEVIPVATGLPGQAIQPPAWVFAQAGTESRRSSLGFDLPASTLLYFPGVLDLLQDHGYTNDSAAALDPIERQYHFIFFHQKSYTGLNEDGENTYLIRWRGLKGLALPIFKTHSERQDSLGVAQQATPDGPSLEVRRALINTAIQYSSSPEEPLLVLGGDLSTSAWGDPLASRSSLHYLAAHPWIWPVAATDLIAVKPSHELDSLDHLSDKPDPAQIFIPNDPSGQPIASGLTTAKIQENFLAELQALPPSRLKETAWRAYLSLIAPAVPDFPNLHLLRAVSLGQLGHLLAAARWQDGGMTAVCGSANVASCSVDLDWDGQPEIILGSEHFFGVFETDGGWLTVAFIRDAGQVHQVTGPSWQFTVGLSDPTLWDIGRGAAGDPGQLPGAFADIQAGYAAPDWTPYQSSLSAQKLTFVSADRKIRKSIHFTTRGLFVDYLSAQPVRVQIPLVIDPWLRFTPGWGNGYRATQNANSLTWSVDKGIQVLVQTSGELTTHTFVDSHQSILLAEDPNLAYPLGHYLPFPMALAEVRAEGQFHIEVVIQSAPP